MSMATHHAPAPDMPRARHVHCLRWDGATQRWWWLDSAAGALLAWSPSAAPALRCALPDDAGAFAHCASSQLLLCQPKRLCLASPPAMPHGRSRRGWQVRALTSVDPAEPRTSIHEGRTDRSGFFVFGTRNDGVDARPIGSFYQYSRQHGLRRLALPAVTIATSICFSPDGARLYFADGLEKRILQCDYDAAGARVANLRIFADTGALPEGATVDRDGNLWNAQAGAGQLVQFSPGGTVLQRLAVPRGAAASAAFGGAALDQISVVSSAGLIHLAANAIGLAEVPFDDLAATATATAHPNTQYAVRNT